MRSRGRLARELVLWTAGVLGSVCLVSMVAGYVFQVTPVVFQSGSMTPDYGVGSLGLAREVTAAEIGVGDVVTVTAQDGSRVTHRVVDTTPTGRDASVLLTLKGDANDVADASTYEVATTDRVFLDVPYLGYPVAFLASPAGMVLGAGLAVAALYLGFRPRGARRADSPARSARRHGVVAAGAVSALVGGVVLAVAGPSVLFTSALWSDTATASATVTATGPVPDTTAPTVTFTYPATGSNINNGQWTNNGCTLVGKPAGLCGTAADNAGGSGIASGAALYELRRTSVTPNTCWNGSSFTSAACGSYQSAGGTASSWQIPLAYGTLPNGTFALRVKVSDVAGNTNRPGTTPGGTADVTFTN